MARRAVALTPDWTGWLAATLVAVSFLAPLAAVLWRAGSGAPVAGDWAALWFTLDQALLSTLLSVCLAIPVARALARRRFTGRATLITLLGAPFLLPVLVAVLGLLTVFGRNGVVNAGLAAMGLPGFSIYGLQGVVLAHVFFNLPLAVRIILQGWQSVPAERFRMSESLGLSGMGFWRHVEAPMLRQVVPGAALLIFALCLTSFAVALILGGGPRATTLELAIYQAFRFDFTPGRAAVLAVMQLALVLGAGLLARRFADTVTGDTLRGRVVQRWDQSGQIGDAVWIGAAALFLLAPMAAVVWNGAPGVIGLPTPVWQAAGLSLGVALAATALTMALAVVLGLVAVRHARLELVVLPGIALSPLVLGTGAFLLIYPITAPERLALPVTVWANTLAALPFAVRLILPVLRQAQADHGALAESLGVGPKIWGLRILWPRLRRPAGFAAGLTAALSMGDLGVIALFADPERATLPLQVMRLMGSYRTDDAAAAALLLFVLSLGLFWIFDRGGRDADA
jgi:thiamine transport system permease protein